MNLNTRLIAATATVSFILAASNFAMAQAKPTAPKAQNASVAMASTDDDVTPDVSTSITKDYKCELNGSLTVYTLKDDDSRAAIRWKNKLYGLKRVATTTGADRFENKKAGLVWIGIPAKGMLLDSIRGEQLANECITASK